MPRPKAQIPGNAEAEGGDGGLIVELGFVVGMPAHAVSTVAVAVQQQAVEIRPQVLVEQTAQPQGFWGPRVDRLLQAAIAVIAAAIGHPAGEPRGAVLLAIHRDQRLLPGQTGDQGSPELLRVEPLLLQPGLAMAQLQARTLNPDQGAGNSRP